MNTKKISFSFHSLCISHNFLLLSLFFSFLLLTLTHAVPWDCTVLSLTQWDFCYPFHQLAQWPLLLFLHLFLLFFLPHSSHQVTINANQLVLTFVRKYDFNSSHWKASPTSSICFADFLDIFQQDHLMSQDKVWVGPTWCNAHPTISHSNPQKRSSIQLFS